MSMLKTILNTDDYPDFVATLVEDYKLAITTDDIMSFYSSGDNVSNAFINCVFNYIESEILYEYHNISISKRVNNLDSHFYVNGEEVRSKKDIESAINEIKNE